MEELENIPSTSYQVRNKSSTRYPESWYFVTCFHPIRFFFFFAPASYFSWFRLNIKQQLNAGRLVHWYDTCGGAGTAGYEWGSSEVRSTVPARAHTQDGVSLGTSCYPWYQVRTWYVPGATQQQYLFPFTSRPEMPVKSLSSVGQYADHHRDREAVSASCTPFLLLIAAISLCTLSTVCCADLFFVQHSPRYFCD